MQEKLAENGHLGVHQSLNINTRFFFYKQRYFSFEARCCLIFGGFQTF